MTWQNRITHYGEEAPDQLLANPRNFRTHPASQTDALAGVLSEVGVVQNVIVNARTGFVVDGHARIALALRTGQPTIPITYVDLSEDEEAVILATLDPLAAMAGTDAAKLDDLLREVSTGDAAVQAMLGELAEAAGIGAGVEAGQGGDEFDTTPDDGPTRTALGDLWIIGGVHRLLVGDCTDAANVARVMGGERADCVFTSPPYAVGVDYGEYQDTIDNLRAMLPKLSALWLDVVTPGGFAVINFGDIASGRNVAGSTSPCEYPMAVEYWPIFRADGWLLWSRRIWCKPNARVNSMWCIGSNRAATDWEHLWTWRKPGEPIIKRVDGEMRSALGWIDTSLMHGVDVGKEVHGAGMALGIVEWMLNIHSRPDSVVFEPFCGTGTTIIGGHRLGRKVYATELSPRFADVILRRAEAEGLSVELCDNPHDGK